MQTRNGYMYPDLGQNPGDLVTGQVDKRFANNSEGKGEEDEGGSKARPFRSILDSLGRYKSELASRGWRLIPNANGYVASHVLYHETTLDVGLDTGDFKLLKQVRHQEGLKSFHYAVQTVHTSLSHKETDKATLNQITQVAYDLTDGGMNRQSNTAKASMLPEYEDDRRLTLNAACNAHKFVPTVDMFPESVRTIPASDLLTLFEEPEMNQLMLILGRACIGASGAGCIEGDIEHTFRSYGIIVGTEAGLGKSTLIGYILRAFDILGYSSEQINSDFNRFGWASIAQADMSTIDDLTPQVQKKMLSDNRIKSVVSNGMLKTENKGIDATNVKSITVLLGCSNSTNYADYIDMDSGMLSRLNLLYSRTAAELRAAYPDEDEFMGTLQQWERLAAKHEVDTTVLAMWLLRMCADKFLDAAGYEMVNGRMVKNKELDTLEQQINANRARFRIDVNLNHVEELVDGCVEAMAMALLAKTAVSRRSALKDIDRSTFTPELLTGYLTALSSAPIQSDSYSRLRGTQLDMATQAYWQPKLHGWTGLNLTKTIHEALTVVLKELKSVKGIGYPHSAMQYETKCQTSRRRVEARVAELETELASMSDTDQEAFVALGEKIGIIMFRKMAQSVV